MGSLVWLGLGALLLLGGATARIILGKNIRTAMLPLQLTLAALGIGAFGLAFAGMDPATLASIKFALIRMSGNVCHCL